MYEDSAALATKCRNYFPNQNDNIRHLGKFCRLISVHPACMHLPVAFENSIG